MAFLRGLLALPLIIGTVAFAMTHTMKVPVVLNPFEPAIELPLYIVALGFLAVGALLGAIVAWIGMHKVRKAKRVQRKEIKNLEKTIGRLESDLAKANVKFSKKEALGENVKDLTPLESSENQGIARKVS